MKSLLFLTLFLAFQVRAETGVFEISGMTCKGCVKSITAKVCKNETFEKCEVEIGKLTLSTKSGSKIDVKQLEDLLLKAGDYKITKSEIK